MLISVLAAVKALSAAVGPAGLAWLVAAATDTSPAGGYVSIALLSAGLTALGVVLSGKIVVPTFAYNREKERADFWQGEAMASSKAIAERHVPALDAAAHAISESNDLLRRTLDRLGRDRQ